jgi:carbon-monoxide dehydrogenase small subunit
MRVDCTVNGEPRVADEVWEGESLLFVLRERLGLPGSKNACEQGECGSCSVYLDGVLVCACLVAAGQAQGAEVVTVEGLAGRAGWEQAGRAEGPAGRAGWEEAGRAEGPGGRAGGDGPGAERLHPVQAAFVEAGAVQCGFCTPGLVVATHDLLRRDPAPTDARIREGLAGNLCRCTGYEKVLAAVRLAAVRLAAARLREEGGSPRRAGPSGPDHPASPERRPPGSSRPGRPRPASWEGGS